jgi:putative copper export protein/methionine-rich copper-binding protein CopC
MEMTRSRGRKRLATVVFGVLCLICGLGATQAGATYAPKTAPGTNILTSSNPAANQIVSMPPTQLQLIFRDPLTSPDVASNMGLSLACNGTSVGLGQAQLGTDFKTVSAALTQIPPAGLCVVSWSLPDFSSGSFNFTSAVAIQTTIVGATGQVVTTDTTIPVLIGETIGEQKSAPRVGGVIGLLRILEYLLMTAIFGGLALVITAWPEGPNYSVMIRYMRLSWIACVATLYLILTLTTMQQTSQNFLSSLNPFEWLSSLTSGSGIVLIFRFALVAACGWVALFPERANDPATQMPAMTLLVLMISTLGFSRLGQDVAIFTYILGAVHGLSVAYWIGGLMLLSRVILIGPGGEDLVGAVLAFSKHSVLAFGVTLFTGSLQIYLLDSASILSSGHGRLGVLKIIITAAMVFIVFAFKNFVHKIFAENNSLTRKMAWRLRRAVTVELGFAVFALVVTSWMISTQPPKAVAQLSAPTATYAFREELRNDRFRVVISMTPGQTGINAMRIELIEPRRINNFTVKLIPQAIGYSGIQINVPLTSQGAAIVSGDGTFVLNVPGIWNIEISGTTTTGDLEKLATTFAVTEASTISTMTSTVTTLPTVVSLPITATTLPSVITLPPATTTVGG